MKRKISIFIATLFSVIMIVFVTNSCKKSTLDTVPSSALTQPNVNTSATDANSLTPDMKSLQQHNLAGPHFNLDVILRGVRGEDQAEDRHGDRHEGWFDSRGEDHSFGFIKFRQDRDTLKIITLDVWVFGLKPNHSYQLQRAVDTDLDGNCTSTTWLTLGKGLTPQSILTDDRGKGQEDLWRDVSSVATGATFDIHFQVIDEDTQAVVLTSDCYQYTVR